MKEIYDRKLPGSDRTIRDAVRDATDPKRPLDYRDKLLLAVIRYGDTPENKKSISDWFNQWNSKKQNQWTKGKRKKEAMQTRILKYIDIMHGEGDLDDGLPIEISDTEEIIAIESMNSRLRVWITAPKIDNDLTKPRREETPRIGR